MHHIETLFYNGRMFASPKPCFPDHNGLYMTRFLAPQKPEGSKGLLGIMYKYADSAVPDYFLLFNPQLRKVLRINTAGRQSPDRRHRHV